MKREKGLKNKGFLNSRCFSKGFLFLFGHRARLVKLTERRFRSRPDMIARTRTKGRQTPDHAPMPFTLSTTQGPIVGMLKFAPEIARASALSVASSLLSLLEATPHCCTKSRRIQRLVSSQRMRWCYLLPCSIS